MCLYFMDFLVLLFAVVNYPVFACPTFGLHFLFDVPSLLFSRLFDVPSHFSFQLYFSSAAPDRAAGRNLPFLGFFCPDPEHRKCK